MRCFNVMQRLTFFFVMYIVQCVQCFEIFFDFAI